jgi:hypothetical protein
VRSSHASESLPSAHTTKAIQENSSPWHTPGQKRVWLSQSFAYFMLQPS